MARGRRRSKGKGKTGQKPGSGLVTSPINGAQMPSGAHAKNTGGKKGRSGRWPKELHAVLAKLRDHPAFHDELYAAATNSDSRGFAAVAKHLLKPEELTVVHPEVQLRVQQTVQLIASQAAWESEALLQKLGGIWNAPPKRVETPA